MDIIKNYVGISFAFKKYITYDISFKNLDYEDYYFLKEIEFKKFNIVISPFVCYIERNNINLQNNDFERILINF